MTAYTEAPYRLYAHIDSPYSMKMCALLRNRRIPHIVAGRMTKWAKAFEQVRVPVMPVLDDPDGTMSRWADEPRDGCDARTR